MPISIHVYIPISIYTIPTYIYLYIPTLYLRGDILIYLPLRRRKDGIGLLLWIPAILIYRGNRDLDIYLYIYIYRERDMYLHVYGGLYPYCYL